MQRPTRYRDVFRRGWRDTVAYHKRKVVPVLGYLLMIGLGVLVHRVFRPWPEVQQEVMIFVWYFASPAVGLAVTVFLWNLHIAPYRMLKEYEAKHPEMLSKRKKFVFKASLWKFWLTQRDRGGGETRAHDPQTAEGAKYDFKMSIFNDNPETTGLQDIRVDFRSGSDLVLGDKALTIRIRGEDGRFRDTGVLTLQARSYAVIGVWGQMSKGILDLLRCHQDLAAYFVACDPSSGEEYEHQVAVRIFGTPLLTPPRVG